MNTETSIDSVREQINAQIAALHHQGLTFSVQADLGVAMLLDVTSMAC